MYRHLTLSLAVAVCLSARPTLVAQKGGKPKPVDQSATASFRCAGLGSAPLCGASGIVVPDSITGDGRPYVGTGTAIQGSGAFLRADGEFALEIRSGGGRTVHLSFAEQVAPPTGTFFRKTFTQATLESFHLNTNVIDPVSGADASGALLAIPVGQTWPSRIKAFWTDPYGVEYTIRFNPRDYPGSSHVSVSRDSDRTWTIEALYTDVARLVSPPQGRRGSLTDEGLYSMPFKLTFTVP
jgi:hypothetical protein